MSVPRSFSIAPVSCFSSRNVMAKVGVRFAGLVRLGDVITCRGKIVAKRPAKEPGRGAGQVDLELWAENQKGEKVVTGRATASLLSRGDD